MANRISDGPMGPGFFIFFQHRPIQTGGGPPAGKAKKTSQITRDDADILAIASILLITGICK